MELVFLQKASGDRSLWYCTLIDRLARAIIVVLLAEIKNCEDVMFNTQLL